MFTQRPVRIPLATLILCLCLGSLFAMPGMNGAVLPVSGMSAIEAENINPPGYDAETDDDAAFLLALKATTADFFSRTFAGMNLDFESASLASISPPPKHT